MEGVALTVLLPLPLGDREGDEEVEVQSVGVPVLQKESVREGVSELVGERLSVAEGEMEDEPEELELELELSVTVTEPLALIEGH